MRNTGPVSYTHLDVYKRQHVDIIITDIKMPIMDGMELIGMLNERFPDIKVIILTEIGRAHV